MYLDKLMKTDKQTPESFWANTSGNDIIYRYVKEASSKMREEFDILASGGVIEKTIKDNITYRELNQVNNIYSFLLFTGYLKAVQCTDQEKGIYQLMIPNKEINRIYTMIFREWFEQQVMQNSIKFAEALMVEDVKAANKVMNDVLFQSISYFDYNERFYHGVLIGMLNDYQVVSNQESGEGRFDLAVLPAYAKERGLLFEVKVVKNMEHMEIAAEQACRQIKDRKYLEVLYKKGYTDIVAYGIVFCKKSCLIVKAE